LPERHTNTTADMEHEKNNKNEPVSSNRHGVQLIAIAKNHPVNKCPFM